MVAAKRCAHAALMTPNDLRPCGPDLTERVIARLGLATTPEPDLHGLDAVYAAVCERVPFDSTLKRTRAAAGGPLPGATAEEFWTRWLAQGTGGTCWAGSGALGSLLTALGFTVHRTLATMHPGPNAREPNHGTLVVDLDDRRYLVDSSITTGVPLPLDGERRAGVVGGAEVRRENGETHVFWRPLHMPAGIVFRIDEIGVSAAVFEARHDASGMFSLFNHGLHVRRANDGGLLGITLGMRVTISSDGAVRARVLDADARVRVMVDELGIDEAVARAVPADEPVPPPPGMPAERWAQVVQGFLAAAPKPG
jgi:N-hydroxyarylamine O-acetyltransferase